MCRYLLRIVNIFIYLNIMVAAAVTSHTLTSEGNIGSRRECCCSVRTRIMSKKANKVAKKAAKNIHARKMSGRRTVTRIKCLLQQNER